MSRVHSLAALAAPMAMAAARTRLGNFLRLSHMPRSRVLLRLGLVAAFMCGGYLGVLLGMPTPEPAPAAPVVLASLASVDEPPLRAPVLVQPLPPIPVEIAKPPTPAPPSADIQTISNGEVLEVQAWLKAFGFDPGPLDGMRGPQTVAAVKRYQAARQKEETGLLDQSLLREVRQQAGHPGR